MDSARTGSAGWNVLSCGDGIGPGRLPVLASHLPPSSEMISGFDFVHTREQREWSTSEVTSFKFLMFPMDDDGVPEEALYAMLPSYESNMN